MRTNPFHAQVLWQVKIAVTRLGRCLDVSCGNGRNLGFLPPGSVGVDDDPVSVEAARRAGHEAYTAAEFFADDSLAKPGAFDSILAANLIEYVQPDQARDILARYLPMVRSRGRVVFITPQERGYAADPAHVTFTDLPALRALSHDLGLQVLTAHSFPFPRRTGKVFVFNEFHVIALVP